MTKAMWEGIGPEARAKRNKLRRWIKRDENKEIKKEDGNIIGIRGGGGRFD